MATWGDFLKEFKVIRMKDASVMYVIVDEVITLWEERNRLRSEVDRLQMELVQEREACAREVEEFAEVCEQESNQTDNVGAVLRAVAGLIRERDQPLDEEDGDGESGA